MIKIALIKPPPTYSNWYQRPVIGISCISSFLEQNGFNARIFDAAFNKWSEKELIQSIETYKPDIVGITSMTHEITQAAHITSLIKERLGISAIIGGCHLTALPERTMSEFPVFDFGIIGEGEETILELLRSLFNGRKTSDIYSIRGLVFRDNGNIVVNEPRPWMDSKRLNSLPYPAFHYYYGNNSKALADKDSYYVMFSSRGCPYHCAFCMQVLGRKIRSFSPERICQEIEAAVSLFGAHTVNFADEIFLFDNDRTREVLNMMIKRGLNRKIRWSGLTRANMVSPEIISLAKLAGCFHLEMGVESGDNKILKAIGKNITTDEIKRAVAIIKENNIMLGTYYILGHPNETRETLSKTLDLAIALNTDTIAVGIMVPYPGTKIFDIAQRGEGGYRLLSTVWSEYDKYGGRALELKGLPYEELLKFQRRAYIDFYLKNFRFIDLMNFFWKRKHALLFFIYKKIRQAI